MRWNFGLSRFSLTKAWSKVLCGMTPVVKVTGHKRQTPLESHRRLENKIVLLMKRKYKLMPN